MLLPQRRSPPYIRLLLKSVIYRSHLLWEKVPRNEADEEGVKGRCAMEKFVYVTDTSSTASGPLDVCEANSTVACNMLSIGEGFGERSFVWATDEGSFCDRDDLGHSGRLSLQCIFFLWATDGNSICDSNDLEQSATCCMDASVPTGLTYILVLRKKQCKEPIGMIHIGSFDIVYLRLWIATISLSSIFVGLIL